MSGLPATDLTLLKQLEQKLLWLSCWTIHNANHLRPNPDGMKVGGHQASCASMVSIMTALYFRMLRPEDRVAVKPHAAPVFHAIQYLMGNQTREKLEAFRAFGGAQSYPSRTKDIDDVDFSTGSVGLGVGITAFAAMVQDYLGAKPWAAKRRAGPHDRAGRRCRTRRGQRLRMPAGGLEARPAQLPGGSSTTTASRLDGVVREGLWQRIEAIFGAFGWDVVTLKYGALQRAAFAEPGGERAARLDRRLPERALLGADLPGRRGLAQAPDGRDRRPGRR